MVEAVHFSRHKSPTTLASTPPRSGWITHHPPYVLIDHNRRVDKAKLVHHQAQTAALAIKPSSHINGGWIKLHPPYLLVSPLRRVTFSLLVQRESNQRESTPGIRVWLRQTPLAPALFLGSSRWAIPGPSFLVWHPCQTPLSTAPTLGLLTGFGDRVVWTICGRQSKT
jgi:hypothetical protein